MSTITELQELTQKGQEQFLAAVRESQQAVVDAVGAWSQTMQGIASAAPPIPGADQLPATQTVIDNTFDLVDKLVASQREFAHNLVAATSPETKTKTTASAAKAAK
jgi:hypothetical protein